eukprot:2487303-Rhodomonas_salina.1
MASGQKGFCRWGGEGWGRVGTHLLCGKSGKVRGTVAFSRCQSLPSLSSGPSAPFSSLLPAFPTHS